jgi:Flp pilus assembly protein TadD
VTDPRLLTQLGEYLTDTGSLGEALAILEPLSRKPDDDADVETLNALGIACARAGRADDARRAFGRVAEILPDSSAPLENLGVLALEQGDIPAAKGYFERAATLAPGSSRAHAGVAATAFRGGDRKTAYEEWAHAVELDPTNFDALYSLGVNLARDGRMDAARPYLDRFLNTAPPALHANERQEVMRLLQSGR